MLLNAIGVGILMGLGIGVIIHVASAWCVWCDHRDELADDYENVIDLLFSGNWFDYD